MVSKLEIPKIILGSGSPRRKDLLAKMGYTFEVRKPECSESYPNDLHPHDVPAYLAKLKSDALLPEIRPDLMLITADTIVSIDGEVIGKPIDEDDAIKMLHTLSGKTHEVVTAFCIRYNNNICIERSITKVSFLSLNHDDISYYVHTFKPLDKAGAYGIQEWIGLIAVSALEGSYHNVMGLPCCLLRQAINRLLSQ